MALLRRLYDKLHLKINESKSAVASAFGRKFLGRSLWAAPKGDVKCDVSIKARETFRPRIRQLTRRSGGRSLAEGNRSAAALRTWDGKRILDWHKHHVSGASWINGCATKCAQFSSSTGGVARPSTSELLAFGASAKVALLAAKNSRRWWHNSRMALNNVLTITYFDRLGMPRVS